MPSAANTDRNQAGGGGLAVRAGDRDAVAITHQLGEHLGTRLQPERAFPLPQPLPGCWY